MKAANRNQLSGLRNVLQKPHEAFSGFGGRFTEPSAKLDEDTSLDFINHRRRNKTRSQKNTSLKTMPVDGLLSRGRLMQ
jgi:hypothetical protein